MRQFWRRLLATDDGIGPVFARVALAIAIFPHGAQKLLGWFGGPGPAGTVGFFELLGIPPAFGWLAIVAEFFGSIGLLLGFLTRVAAFGIGCVMLVAMALVHRHVGFFMNWTGQQPGEGFEYHILALGLALLLMATGAGRWSIDRWLTRGAEPTRSEARPERPHDRHAA